jgi:hypothetical protein
MALRHEWEETDDRKSEVQREMEAVQRDMAILQDDMREADQAS